VRFAADEAIEILKASAAGRPVIKRTDRAALPDGHFMTFAELGSGIAVEFQRLSQSCAGVRLHGILSRRGRCEFRDRAHANRMMVPAAEQRGTCRRAQSGRMEPRVLQAMGCQLLEIGRVAGPAERRR